MAAKTLPAPHKLIRIEDDAEVARRMEPAFLATELTKAAAASRSRGFSNVPFARLTEQSAQEMLDTDLIAYPEWMQASPTGRQLYVNGHELAFNIDGFADRIIASLASGATGLRDDFGPDIATEITRRLIVVGGMASTS